MVHILLVRTVELRCRYKISADSYAFAFSQINVECSEVMLSHIHPTPNRRQNSSLQQWLTTSLKAGQHWIQIRFYFGLNNIFRTISLNVIICLTWFFCFFSPHLNLYWSKTDCNLNQKRTIKRFETDVLYTNTALRVVRYTPRSVSTWLTYIQFGYFLYNMLPKSVINMALKWVEKDIIFSKNILNLEVNLYF